MNKIKKKKNGVKMNFIDNKNKKNCKKLVFFK